MHSQTALNLTNMNLCNIITNPAIAVFEKVNFVKIKR
jgi:hypothetical protein